MRAPTEILGIRYFLLGVIFTRTDTRVESSHQGTPQNKNKSFFLSFPDCQSLWAGSAYITLGVASAFGPDHYILPHITQRIQAASAFQAGPHFISYPGAVPTLSRLHRASASDPMRVQTCHNGYIWVDRAGQDQEWTANRMERFAPSDIIFDFQHMYISRRGDTVGPPVWKSIILHVFSKSELSVLEAMAVRVPMMYVAPSTLSHTNSYRVSDCAISHLVPLRCRA